LAENQLPSAVEVGKRSLDEWTKKISVARKIVLVLLLPNYNEEALFCLKNRNICARANCQETNYI
jgi:hypothetical protein